MTDPKPDKPGADPQSLLSAGDTASPGSSPARPAVTPVRVLAWSLPLLASLLVLAATFAFNWEPWFGYASVIAGVLGSLMVVGEALGARGG